MKLSAYQLIFLTYLTNYDIRVIKEYSNLYDEFDQIISEYLKNFRLKESVVEHAFKKTDVALDKLNYHGIKYITKYENNYPDKLKRITDAPPIIYYKGKLIDTDFAAVVGSRKISKFAEKITFKIVDWLNDHGYGVVSGLALGIDSLAHVRAIQNKQYTLAVMPNSLDAIYPQENYRLANNILDNGGGLISELTFNINRGKKSFVQRNRIQAALSDLVIPIEMSVKSGTMHTIDFAKRYQKNVGLFKPTPLLSELEQYSGIKHLINNPSKGQFIFSNKEEFDRYFRNTKFNHQLDLGFNDIGLSG